MRSRIPFAVAVVGALLVGGAATGTTRASWAGQASLAGQSMHAGSMGFVTSTPAGVTLDQTDSSTASTDFVVDDTSAGKNLRQRITATIAGTPDGVAATVGTSCPGSSTVQIDTFATSADVPLCVRVVSSTTAVSGTVTLLLAGSQRPSGWTTPVTTVSVPVTVNPPVGLAVTCDTRIDNRTYRITWAAHPGATSYTIWQGATAQGPFSQVASGSGLSYTSTGFGGQETRWFQIRSDNGGVSNTLGLSRLGNEWTCPVTP